MLVDTKFILTFAFVKTNIIVADCGKTAIYQ